MPEIPAILTDFFSPYSKHCRLKYRHNLTLFLKKIPNITTQTNPKSAATEIILSQTPSLLNMPALIFFFPLSNLRNFPLLIY